MGARAGDPYLGLPWRWKSNAASEQMSPTPGTCTVKSRMKARMAGAHLGRLKYRMKGVTTMLAISSRNSSACARQNSLSVGMRARMGSRCVGMRVEDRAPAVLACMQRVSAVAKSFKENGDEASAAAACAAGEGQKGRLVAGKEGPPVLAKPSRRGMRRREH